MISGEKEVFKWKNIHFSKTSVHTVNIPDEVKKLQEDNNDARIVLSTCCLVHFYISGV